MEINGIDVDALTPTDTFPSVIEGRVLQLDADSVLYLATYEEKPFNTCMEKFWSIVEYRQRMSRSEFVNVHLTGGNKGGRFKIATVKEYQANRNGKTKPSQLSMVKERVVDGITAKQCGWEPTVRVILHTDQEADDGMAQGNYAALQAGTPELSVIMSMDKDLWMCSGLHCNWNTYEITRVSGFGSFFLDRSGSAPKIKGFGTSFFWCQLLMGDTADNIPGLPKLGGDILNMVDPTKKVEADLEILETHTSESTKWIAARKRLDNRKPKSCGTVLAYSILKDIKNDRDALNVVVRCYQSYYGLEVFTHSTWDGRDIKRTSKEMLLEQARLLWMRRVEDEDASAFFKDVIEGRLWDGRSI